MWAMDVDCKKKGKRKRRFTRHMNLMVGHRCPIIHRLNPKDCVDIKNGQLKAIKAALRFSCRHVHALMFEVGFYF